VSRSKRPTPAAAPRPAPLKRGRLTREAKAERLEFIAKLFAQTASVAIVVRAAREKFGISSATTRRWLDHVRSAFSKAPPDLEELRQTYRAGIHADLNHARAAGKPTTGYWALLLQLDPLVTTQLEVTKRDPLTEFIAPLPGPQRVAVIRFVQAHNRLPKPGEVVVEASTGAGPRRLRSAL
jgi:hypothetical protein